MKLQECILHCFFSIIPSYLYVTKGGKTCNLKIFSKKKGWNYFVISSFFPAVTLNVKSSYFDSKYFSSIFIISFALFNCCIIILNNCNCKWMRSKGHEFKYFTIENHFRQFQYLIIILNFCSETSLETYVDLLS